MCEVCAEAVWEEERGGGGREEGGDDVRRAWWLRGVGSGREDEVEDCLKNNPRRYVCRVLRFGFFIDEKRREDRRRKDVFTYDKDAINAVHRKHTPTEVDNPSGEGARELCIGLAAT